MTSNSTTCVISMEKRPLRRSRMTRKRRSKLIASGLPDVVPVECGELRAKLHVNKIGSGTRGPSIEWDGMWLTPCQFEEISGLGSIRNWKRTIRHENRSLNCYIKLGVIQLHQRYCDCDRCITPLMEMGERRSSKRVKYGKRDSAPDGIDGGGIDYESSGSGDDDSVFTMSDGSPSLPKRRKQKRKNVRFIDVSDSGYSTLPRSAPIHEVTDEREGVTYKTTSNSSVLANRSSSDEGYQWQTTGCTEGRPESGNQHSTRYIELDDNYDSGQFVSDVPTALNVPERQTVQRSPQGTSTSRGRSTISSPKYRRSRGSGPRSRFAGRARYSSEIQKQTNDISSKFDSDTASVQGFGSTELIVTREVTIHDRLTAALTKAGLASDNPLAWTVEQVASFIHAAGFPFQSSLFRQHLINGEALMKMQERHLTDYLKVKLGPSLRLFALVKGLQNK